MRIIERNRKNSLLEKEEIILIMSFIKDCGIYAKKFNNGEICKENVDMKKTAYINDNLYNIICDRIAQL